LEHLSENQEIKNDVVQDDWSPPSGLLILERYVSKDEHRINNHGQAERHLGVSLELEL